MGNSSNREKMLVHVASWENSGISQAAYCRRENINLHTFRYWVIKQRRESESFEGFVHLDQVPAAEICLRYPNGVELFVPVHTPARTILELIKA